MAAADLSSRWAARFSRKNQIRAVSRAPERANTIVAQAR
jgi:hypothetical protein